MSNEINHRIDRFKESFLCAAARGGRIEECASLLEFGADIEWRENNEDNPLLAAVRNGMNDVAALLLAHGANPAVLDQDGNTVMHLAAFIGDEGIASLFSPNASALSLRTNNDGMTAIDIAVERGFNSFAEHLNNLVYEADDNRNDCEEEQDDLFLPSIEDDSTDDSEHSVADYNVSNEASDSGRTGERMVQLSATANESIDEGIAPNIMNNPRESSVDVGEHDTVTSSDLNPGGADHDAFMKQLGYMTLLAHAKSTELYQSKYALNEVIQERDSLKNELAIFRGDDNTDLAQKSLTELNALEEQVKRSLDRIVKAKQVASSNIDDVRKCVICRENTKSVLFMDCRHLCVCKDCGHLNVLVQCPLCRQIIRERINVFTDN
ncbi:hypothetical protein ACHAW5_010470 [Stephanodiscus triporus]|uniref:RING-type domain-containing protein n=1 Tax=Stephanodiscus triporus TaxID=2934178 RepID=A0ABD3P840_9STRA